ncbi:MAG TPA: amidohydrolase family protein, partial [Acidimicrobiales bacterium]|nr:amidohydrolase family protein [Acidimicrobiales bacterium]
MTRQYRLISADGHVVEPPDMWTKYLPKKFHDRAPKLVKDAKGGDAWELVPGTPPMPLGLVTNAGQFGKRYEDLEWFGSTYDSILKGSFQGKARVDEQDFDGVDAEVLFPSQRTMGAFMAQDDDDYHLAGLEAYNTWMHDEFMAASPERLIGLAQMPGVDIQTSVKWLKNAKAAGYKGVIISAYPSGNSDLSAEDDAFWEAAEEEQLPVHIHSGLRQAGKRTAGSFQKAAASAGREIGLAEMGGPVGEASGFMSKFIYSG